MGRIDPMGTSFWGWGDDQWVGFSAWASGRDGKDWNGNPVRVGSWPALFNWSNDNAERIRGTVHLRNEETFEKYDYDQHWMDHEEGHIAQCFDIGDLLPYAAGHLYGYLMEKVTLQGKPSQENGTWTGHDYNPYGQFAEQYAYGKDGQWKFGSPRP